VLTERVTRTDADVIGCGHTHIAAIHEVGRRIVVNAGSCGYAFDNDPAASWAMVTLDSEGSSAELFRTPYAVQEVSDELSLRGLPGDIYRAAIVRTGRFVR
jgi:predicted phosphodiesterase